MTASRAADIVLEGATVYSGDDEDRFLPEHDLGITGGRIAVLAPRGGVSGAVRLDVRGLVLLPGFINSHTHLALRALRGTLDDLELFPWLRAVTPLIRSLTRGEIASAAEEACRDLVRSGVTCACDCGPDGPAVVIEAARRTGLRLVCGPMVRSEWMGEPVADSLTHAVDEIRDLSGRLPGMSDRVRLFLGAHSPFHCTDEVLRDTKRLATQMGLDFVIHLAECREEVSLMRSRSGRTPVQHLAALGVLDERSLLIHGVWLTPEDIAVIRAGGARLAHCPVSNAKLASGIAPIPECLRQGIPVGLGTDSAATNNALDMFQEMKFAVLIQRASRLQPDAMTAADAVGMATRGGARSVGLSHEAGVLAPGRLADIIGLAIPGPHARAAAGVRSHVVFAGSPADVRLVMIGGDIVYRDGEFVPPPPRDPEPSGSRPGAPT